MTNNSWRTLVIQEHASLSLRDENIVISLDSKEESIPLEQIRMLFIHTGTGCVSFPLLSKLSEKNVKVIFCNQKKNPVSELIPYNGNFEMAGRMMDQAAWSKRKKNTVWRQIIKMKILQQMSLLDILGLKIPEELSKYYHQVEQGDSTNREAMATKIYFDVLFGKEFRRFALDKMNAGLNYGYAILCSAFNRTIVMNGYSTALGIHHCNRQNPYNLSCDLMEPFRPFVDRIVYDNKNCELDWDYRKKLISLLYQECRYNGKVTDITTAIESYVRDIVKGMSKPYYRSEEISFAEASGSNSGDV